MRRRTALAHEPLERRTLLSATTLSPVADTFTRAGVSAGTAQTLVVQDNNGSGGDVMAYLRFDLSQVDLTGVTNAFLTLQKIGGDTIVTDRFDVFGLANIAANTPQNWSETTLANTGLGAEYTTTSGNGLDSARVVKLDCDGTAGANVIEQVSNSGSPQHLSGVDLVQFLRDRKADGGLATFIALVDAGASRGWSYGARENATAALRPTLRLDFTPAYAKVANLPARQMEALNRGLIALRRATTQVYLGWRLLGTDPAAVGFNVYRSANGGTPVKLTATPLTSSTNYVDTSFNAAATNTYTVRPVVNGVEQPPSEAVVLAANAAVRQCLTIPLDIPPGGLVPDVANPGQFLSYTYTANDSSVGDLDGDGAYEIILKWSPSNESNAAFAGYTGPTIFDAYKLDGTRLWRINLGRNIRSGAQYCPFLVYDLDGDGRAEVVSRTMPGTVDGQGRDVILAGDDPAADYRDSSGRITTGPEYLTVFSGPTGAALATVPLTPDRQDISTWGDGYGHRGENLMLAPAYLDGTRPSIVVGRGVFTPSGTLPARNELTAWNWRDGRLTQQWWFRADIGVNDNVNSEYVGQANYTMIPADVDGDGRDEIVYGAMVVNDDGTGLYSTGRGHGDALHVSDMDPSNPGPEVFMPHEWTSLGNHTTATLRDAATGLLLAAPLVAPADVAAGSFPDVGRGIALDIDPNHPGYEFWDSYDPDIYDCHGNAIYPKPSNMHVNFGVWWDGDLLRETLDNTTISDWNFTTHGRSTLVSYASSGINNSSGLSDNNGTKATPCLSGDILGDWREEVIWRTSDNSALQIWSTTIAATNRIFTLVHDSQYREALAWQNVGYNQPPNPSFFLGDGMAAAPTPNIYTVAYVPNVAPSAIALAMRTIAENAGASALAGQLTTTDANAGDTFTYALVAGPGATHNAQFVIVGSQLMAVASLDYEAGASRSVRIRSTDAGGLSVEATFVIIVTDVLDDYVIAVATGQQLTDPALPAGLFRLVKQGAGTLVFTGSNTYVGGTVVETGSVVAHSAMALGTGGWDVRSNATLVVDISAGAAVSVPTLALATATPAASLDVGTSPVRIGGGLTSRELVSRLTAGRGAGSWSGNGGITSSAVAAAIASGQPRAVGWRDDSGGAFTIAFAAPGDINLDGSIDILDAARILAAGRFDTGAAATWAEGDSNYDGFFDVLDVADFIGTGLFNRSDSLAMTQSAAAMAASPAAARTLSSVEVAFIALVGQEAATPVKTARRFAK
ncbi:MAG: autotransporter-associated beta strand repeat-containing protein [Pirellulales bacterium]